MPEGPGGRGSWITKKSQGRGSGILKRSGGRGSPNPLEVTGRTCLLFVKNILLAVQIMKNQSGVATLLHK